MIGGLIVLGIVTAAAVGFALSEPTDDPHRWDVR